MEQTVLWCSLLDAKIIARQPLAINKYHEDTVLISRYKWHNGHPRKTSALFAQEKSLCLSRVDVGARNRNRTWRQRCISFSFTVGQTSEPTTLSAYCGDVLCTMLRESHSLAFKPSFYGLYWAGERRFTLGAFKLRRGWSQRRFREDWEEIIRLRGSQWQASLRLEPHAKIAKFMKIPNR